MAWRPYEQFIEGILDNTIPGKVTGWMRFAGMKDKVIFDLEGNFHRDIRGARIRLWGEGESADQEESARYMKGFSTLQKGNVGDMTAGREPADYVNYGYYEWYSEDNGRVVLEFEPDQIELLSNPIPACESEPVSRKEQAQNMANFLSGLASGLNIPSSNAIAVGDTVAVEKAKKAADNDKIRGMKLLPKEIREKLPALYSQDGKGGKAIVQVKFFTPDSNWTWYATEGEPMLNDAGSEVDFQFFGLVDGLEKELGYFMLSELEEVRGPMGLPIERDLHWQPKTLSEIAPEMFRED
jgi:exonuclease III